MRYGSRNCVDRRSARNLGTRRAPIVVTSVSLTLFVLLVASGIKPFLPYSIPLELAMTVYVALPAFLASLIVVKRGSWFRARWLFSLNIGLNLLMLAFALLFYFSCLVLLTYPV